MISAILFLNEKGEIILVRNYRGDVSRTSTEAFRNAIIVKKNTKYPIVQIGHVSFFYIREKDVYVVAVCKGNINGAVIFESLHKLVSVFKSYFGGVFDEDAISKNYGLIYELLDECFDFGYPQSIDAEILKTYILQGKPITVAQAQKVSIHATGASSRAPNIQYKTNELFIDVVEQVNVLISGKRSVLLAEVIGEIKMNVKLSGDPECIFGFNDKLFLDTHNEVKSAKRGGDNLELDDIKFHQCVKLGKFSTDRTIAFIPPDGEFVLMKYRVSERVVRAPFNLVPVIIEYSKTRFIVTVNLSTTFNPQFVATQVVVTIPVPNNSARVASETTIGAAKYEPTKHSVVWRIKTFPGQTTHTFSANVQLLATVTQSVPWDKPPISMQFLVPMATSSGMEVLFMNVSEPKLHYHADRFIRYMTRGGNYLIRYPDNVGQVLEADKRRK